MEPTLVSDKEALDHALIQCLRLFARLGRRIRIQGQTDRCISAGNQGMRMEEQDCVDLSLDS